MSICSLVAVAQLAVVPAALPTSPAALPARPAALPTSPAALPTSLPVARQGHDVSPSKRAAIATVDQLRPDMVRLADEVWGFAETALLEKQSAEVLANYAESKGFEVARGVAGMPTAFVASFGSGKPIIGIMGEFDALPGLSQKAQTTQEAAVEGGAGHGCGHNLFGAASLGAAVAIRDLIAAGELEGTIRFYGTPAEESVGGKIYMVRAGLFDDVDVALAWHPSNETRADTDSSQALVDFVVEFRGRASHAAYDPWNGRSALDGIEVFTHSLNLMREHVRPSVRMHYAIIETGKVPNIVPERAKLWCWLRDSKHQGVDELLERVRKIADGAALATETEATLTVQAGDYEMLVNMEGARLLHENLRWMGPLSFSEEQHAFARAIQKACGVDETGLDESIAPLPKEAGEPQGGSTDVGDVSWNVPTLHLSVTTAPQGTPWHAWPVVACGGMSIGHDGMTYAAKVLAASMVDLYEDDARRAAIRAEFDAQTRGLDYKPYIPDGPPPVPEE